MHIGKEYERDNRLRVFCQAAAYPRWLPKSYWLGVPNWHNTPPAVPLSTDAYTGDASYTIGQDHVTYVASVPFSDGVPVELKMIWKLNAAKSSTELHCEVRRAGVLQATYVQYPGTQEMRNGFCGPAVPQAGAVEYPIGPFGSALAIEYAAVAWDGFPV